MSNLDKSDTSRGILMAGAEPISPKEIKDSGLLSYINDFISIFNICLIYDKNNDTIFPAKITLHGSVDRRTGKLISYIKKNSRKGGK